MYDPCGYVSICGMRDTKVKILEISFQKHETPSMVYSSFYGPWNPLLSSFQISKNFIPQGSYSQSSPWTINKSTTSPILHEMNSSNSKNFFLSTLQPWSFSVDWLVNSASLNYLTFGLKAYQHVGWYKCSTRMITEEHWILTAHLDIVLAIWDLSSRHRF